MFQFKQRVQYNTLKIKRTSKNKSKEESINQSNSSQVQTDSQSTYTVCAICIASVALAAFAEDIIYCLGVEKRKGNGCCVRSEDD